MIDIFLRTNSPITDMQKLLSGFDCSRVLVRDGGPTAIWQKTADGWAQDKPGMTLFEDLSSDHISLCAYRADACGSVPVEGVVTLVLEHSEAIEWLASMAVHRYAVEDAIGCSVNVEHMGAEVYCASALFAISEFKSMNRGTSELARKILSWVEDALAAGADQIDAAIACARSSPLRTLNSSTSA